MDARRANWSAAPLVEATERSATSTAIRRRRCALAAPGALLASTPLVLPVGARDDWISWARRCRIPAFVELQRRSTNHRVTIDATLDTGQSHTLIESTNTKIRLLTRIAFIFHDPHALVALALLNSVPTNPAPRPELTHTNSRSA